MASGAIPLTNEFWLSDIHIHTGFTKSFAQGRGWEINRRTFTVKLESSPR